MGYKGLMQIPWPIYYTDANMIIGAHIFNEKDGSNKQKYRKGYLSV